LIKFGLYSIKIDFTHSINAFNFSFHGFIGEGLEGDFIFAI
jgi:hypothetical protein